MNKDSYASIFYDFLINLKSVIKDNDTHIWRKENNAQAFDLLADIPLELPNSFIAPLIPNYVYPESALFTVESIRVDKLNSLSPKVSIDGTVTINPNTISTTLLPVSLAPVDCTDFISSELLQISLDLLFDTEVERKNKQQEVLGKQGFGQW